MIDINKRIERETDAEMLDNLQRETFDYFIEQVNPVTGLIADKTQPGFPSSIAVVGMGITAHIAGVHKKFRYMCSQDTNIKLV